MKVKYFFYLLITILLFVNSQYLFCQEIRDNNVTITLLNKFDYSEYKFNHNYWHLEPLNAKGDWWGQVYKNDKYYTIINNQVFGPYDMASLPAFSKENRQWAFAYNIGGEYNPYFRGGLWYVKTNTSIYGPFDYIEDNPGFINFSTDGSKLMFFAVKDGINYFVLNGEKVCTYNNTGRTCIRFSDDNTMWSCMTIGDNNHLLIVNGIKYGAFANLGSRTIESPPPHENLICYLDVIDYSLGSGGNFSYSVKTLKQSFLYVNNTIIGNYAELHSISYIKNLNKWMVLSTYNKNFWDLLSFTGSSVDPEIILSFKYNDLITYGQSYDKNVFAFLYKKEDAIILNYNGTDEILNFHNLYNQYQIIFSEDKKHWAVLAVGTKDNPKLIGLNFKNNVYTFSNYTFDDIEVEINDQIWCIHIINDSEEYFIVGNSIFGPFKNKKTDEDWLLQINNAKQYKIRLAPIGTNFSININKNNMNTDYKSNIVKIINGNYFDSFTKQLDETYYSGDGRIWAYPGYKESQGYLNINGRHYGPFGIIRIKETENGLILLSWKNDIVEVYKIE